MDKIWAYIRSISLKNVIGNILVLIVGYLLIHTYQTWNTPKGVVPTIQGVELLGSEYVELNKLEKPVLVHFWATWCKICQFEHSSIISIAKDYPVLSVASQSGSASEVKSFMREKGLDFPVILDRNGELFERWGGVGYPTSFVVNEKNEVEYVEAGFTTEFGLRARLFLAKYF